MSKAVVYWGAGRVRLGWWLRLPTGAVWMVHGPAIQASNRDLRRAVAGMWPGPVRIERTWEVWWERLRWKLYRLGLVKRL